MKQKFEELVRDIQRAYEEGVTMEEAERLAAKFLHAQVQVSQALVEVDLDARMKKTGVKALRAAVYMEGATKGDKKPSDVMLEAQVNMSEIVQKEQDSLDTAEVNRDELERYLHVFKESHIFFRSVARGSFNG